MILNGYDIEGAKKILFNTDHKINIVGVEEIFYPYILIGYSVFVGKGRLSRLNKRYHCIIDGVSGTTYEGDGTPTFVDIEIEEKNTLPLRVTMEESRVTGHNFVIKQFLGKAKLLMVPVIEIIKEDTFYKKFYVMHCLDDEDRDYYILVDAIDGGLSVLDHYGEDKQYAVK